MKPYKHVHQTVLHLAGYLLQMAATDGGQVTFDVTRGPTGEERRIGTYDGSTADRERLIFDLVRDFNAHGLEDEVHISGRYEPRYTGRVDVSARVDPTGLSIAARVEFGPPLPATGTDAVN